MIDDVQRPKNDPRKISVKTGMERLGINDEGYIYCKYCKIYGYHQSEVCNYPHLIVGHTPPFETVDKKGP